MDKNSKTKGITIVLYNPIRCIVNLFRLQYIPAHGGSDEKIVYGRYSLVEVDK